MKNRLIQTARFSDGVRACLPTIMGYLGIGIAMGIVRKSVHLAIWQIFFNVHSNLRRQRNLSYVVYFY